MHIHGKTMNMVPWMAIEWNAMHVCASQGTYSHDMQDYDEFIIIYKER